MGVVEAVTGVFTPIDIDRFQIRECIADVDANGRVCADHIGNRNAVIEGDVVLSRQRASGYRGLPCSVRGLTIHVSVPRCRSGGVPAVLKSGCA